MNQLLSFAAIFLILFTSCQSPKPTGGNLDNTSWLLVLMKNEGKPVPLDAKHMIYASFAEGKVNGKSACNRYFGEVKTEGANLSITGIGSTKMACPDVMSLESDYLNLLGKAKTYSIKGDDLKIHCERGLLVFSKYSAGAETTGLLPADFQVAGTEPFWRCAIYKSKNSIEFQDMEMSSPIIFPYQTPVSTPEGWTVKTTSADAKDSVVIAVSQGQCSDGMSDFLYEFKSVVAHNGKEYHGCGQSIQQ